MRSSVVLDLLRAFESRNVTFIEPDGSWPIVWERARGVHVWDADGRKYPRPHRGLRCRRRGPRQSPRRPGRTAPDGKTVARDGRCPSPRPESPIGSRTEPPHLRALGRRQAKNPRGKLKGKTIFCNSGFEAVEAALKTAMLATSKSGVIAFEGAYHGLGYGALNATHRDHFRAPFRSQLAGFAEFVGFPATPRQLKKTAPQIRDLLHYKEIGAVLVEPVQARGGINVPPRKFSARRCAACATNMARC